MSVVNYTTFLKQRFYKRKGRAKKFLGAIAL
jgi:hypothetical protein